MVRSLLGPFVWVLCCGSCGGFWAVIEKPHPDLREPPGETSGVSFFWRPALMEAMTCLQRILSGWGRALLLVVLGWAAAGCSHVGYYAQAVSGQCGVWARQRSVESLLERPDTSPALRRQLAFAVRIREFARDELHLDSGGSYRRYADLGRDYVSWSVTAAPAYSLEPKEWWYPVVGSLSYRGYFREDSARVLANELRSEGWDVSVGGVTAYSTLGWFSDPLLNTYIFDSEVRLADLLFHELAHRRFFVAGDTEFNEAFATAVAAEGVKRWLEHTGDSNLVAAVQRQEPRDDAVRRVLLAGRNRLSALYRETAEPTALRDGKTREFERITAELRDLATDWGDDRAVEPWLRAPLNNARLNDVATYYELVPKFEGLLRDCGGDLESWYRRVEKIGELGRVERRSALKERTERFSLR
jgi:predicted aminopeptidase